MKCALAWLSSVVFCKTITKQWPAVIRDMICKSKRPWYLSSMIFMSWWNLSPCSSLTSPRFSEKFSKWLNRCSFLHQELESFWAYHSQVAHSFLLSCCLGILLSPWHTNTWHPSEQLSCDQWMTHRWSVCEFVVHWRFPLSIFPLWDQEMFWWLFSTAGKKNIYFIDLAWSRTCTFKWLPW